MHQETMSDMAFMARHRDNAPDTPDALLVSYARRHGHDATRDMLEAAAHDFWAWVENSENTPSAA